MTASKTTLVASLTAPPADDAAILSLPAGVGFLEVRADLIGEIDPAWLRERFPGELIYTWRSRAEGGAGDNSRATRQRHLLAACPAYDLIDLEGERDLSPEVLAAIPASQRLISWHGPAELPSELLARFTQFATTPARFYKLIPTATQAIDCLHTLSFLHALERHDTVAFAAGVSGTWTRILAPRLGSPLVYCALGGPPAAPGQLTLTQFATDYGSPTGSPTGLPIGLPTDLSQQPPAEFLCGIVGRPVSHSLSPRLHNQAYRALGLPGLYLPFHAETFGDFWLEVVESNLLEQFGLPLRGLSVTAPFKEVALAVSGASSPRAQHIGAANTLVFHEGVWEAENTDPEGVVGALANHGIVPRGLRAAVVGCGGAGKAAAYGLEVAGASVVLVNRSRERGQNAARELALPFTLLQDFDPKAFDLVVQATSLGHQASDPLPFAVDQLAAKAVVIDLVYGTQPTPLLAQAQARGLRTIDGREVLLAQALEQFRLFTGHSLSASLARQILSLTAPEAGSEGFR